MATDSEGQAACALTVGKRAVILRVRAVNPSMIRVDVQDADGRVSLNAPEFTLEDCGGVVAEVSELAETRCVAWGRNQIRLSANPLTIAVADADGRACQTISIDDDGVVTFSLGAGPLFGLGQGGRQFDRRLGVFPLLNGQGEGERSADMNVPGARAPVYAFRPCSRRRADHHSLAAQQRRTRNLFPRALRGVRPDRR